MKEETMIVITRAKNGWLATIMKGKGQEPDTVIAATFSDLAMMLKSEVE